MTTFIFCDQSSAEALLAQDADAALLFRPIPAGANLRGKACRGEYECLERLSRQRPKPGFSPNPLGARHDERLLRRALIGLSAGVCLSTSAYAAMNLAALRAIESGLQQQERRIAEFHEHAATLEANLRQHGLPPERLPALFARRQELLGRQGDFPRLLDKLSQAWESCPGLTLNTLDWQAHENAAQPPEQHLSLVGHTGEDGTAADSTCLATEISRLADCRGSTGALPTDASITGETGHAPEERTAGFSLTAVCHR